VEAICEYANLCLHEIGTTYDCKVKYIMLWKTNTNRAVLQRVG
jgi:hypothetical protein